MPGTLEKDGCLLNLLHIVTKLIQKHFLKCKLHLHQFQFKLAKTTLSDIILNTWEYPVWEYPVRN